MKIKKLKIDRIEIVTILLCFIATIAVCLGAIIYSIYIPSTGTITAVGNLAVYSDANAQHPLATINWGTIDPTNTSAVSVSIYVKNIGNIAETLSLSTSNWNPQIYSQYMIVSWNYINGTYIQPQTIQPITLVLTVTNTSPAGNFNVGITITATAMGDT